jgi:hypothetical protein
VILLNVFTGAALASPSTFPETAAFFRVGYTSSLSISVGAELLLAIPFVDASAGLEVYFRPNETYGVRLDTTVLVFPALGTKPPIALGLGSDLNLDQSGFSLHVGPVAGTDLLFTTDLPMIASLYLGPGYASSTGFSLAWSAQVRYYFDEFALELSSSDLYYLSLALRFVF